MTSSIVPETKINADQEVSVGLNSRAKTVCWNCGEMFTECRAQGGKSCKKRLKETKGGRQATGICFQGNHHLAHGNKLPALPKQAEMGGVARADNGSGANS